MMRTGLAAISIVLTLALQVGAALAQSSGLPVSHSLVSDSALAGSTGNIAVNNSAGIGNAQANMAVLAIGGDVANARIDSRQQAPREAGAVSGNERAEIGSNAFRNATGIIAINQSSGNGNTQANLVAIASGSMSEVSIDQLGRVSAAPAVTGRPGGAAEKSGKQRSLIADTAFAGARGIVQVNQLAGSGNSAANVFALSIGAGTP